MLSVSGIEILNDAQRKLVAEHTDVVKWAIYEHIKVNENVFGLGYDDLYQEGCVCLCKAAATYDGDKAKFITYAQVVVRSKLLTYCVKMSAKHKHHVSVDDIPDESDDYGGSGNRAIEDDYGAMLSNSFVYGLLASMKFEYSGTVRLGIEALELKVKGYTGAEIARMWGVGQNHVGAWISKAKKKLVQNERFISELKAG